MWCGRERRTGEYGLGAAGEGEAGVDVCLQLRPINLPAFQEHKASGRPACGALGEAGQDLGTGTRQAEETAKASQVGSSVEQRSGRSLAPAGLWGFQLCLKLSQI